MDEWDKELERRGHRFVRYADDSNIYVRSRRAGERVLAWCRRFLERRWQLVVNESKSAVARPWARSFLGYSITLHRRPRLRQAGEAVVEATRAEVRARHGRLPHGWDPLLAVLGGGGLLPPIAPASVSASDPVALRSWCGPPPWSTPATVCASWRTSPRMPRWSPWRA